MTDRRTDSESPKPIVAPPQVTSSEELRRLRHDRIALYASLLENLPAYIICKDVKGRFIYANEKFARRLGKPAFEIVGKTDFELYPRETAQRYRDEDLRIMSSGELLDVVAEEIEEGQAPSYFKLRKAPLRDAEGEIIGTQAIFWDVTQQRLAEQASEYEHKMLRTIMNHVPDYIYVKDTSGRYVLVNEAASFALGASSVDEVIGKSSVEFLETGMAQRQQFDDMRVLRTRQPLIDREDKILDEQGNTKWLLTTKVPLKDDQGKITGLVGIDRNISKLKATEAALRSAKEVADAANQAKGDFLANMSHEIRTPMNAIIGMTDLLLNTKLNEPQREYLEMVQQSGESLLTLINDILDFSKIEAGKLELDHSDFHLADRLGDTMKSLSLRASTKGLELAFRIARDVPAFVHGDLGRLRQIIVNLVGNAIKFTEEGQVVLSVTKNSQSADQTELEFCVADTGIGIPREKCKTIFQEFEQADSSTTRRFGGTGLGLAISARLIELMGGKIWVESRLGQGSRFQFTAKFGTAAEPEESLPADLATSLEDTPVLVVDHNATSREIIDEMLTNWGMRPILVDNVDDAQEKLRSATAAGNPVPLVIADANPPSNQGLSFLDEIQQDAAFGQPESILLTSLPAAEITERCDDLGAECLIKPVKQSELFDAIAIAMDSTLLHPRREDSPTVSLSGLQPRVLLAEDNVVNQRLAVGSLEALGCTVTLAKNGQEAVERFASTTFDVILMDVQMPKMDGLTATKAIRERESETGGRIPIVAMTAHAMAGDRDLCLAAGMDDYLSKPIRLQSLSEKLVDIMGADQSPTVGETEVSDIASTEVLPLQSVTGVVDWEHARKGVAYDDRLLATVVAAFLEDQPRMIQAVRDAWDGRDAAELARAAHSLKGALLILNATNAIEIAESIELDAAEGRLDDEPERIDRLAAAFAKVVAELQKRNETGG